MDSGDKGAAPTAHIMLASIELDPVLDDARFGKPVAAPPSAAAKP